MISLKNVQIKYFTHKLFNKLKFTNRFNSYNYLTNTVKLFSSNIKINVDKSKKVFSELDIEAFEAEINHLLQ